MCINSNLKQIQRHNVEFLNYFVQKGKKSILYTQLRKGFLMNSEDYSVNFIFKNNYKNLLNYVPLFYIKRVKYRRRKKKDKILFLLTEKRNLLYLQLYRLLTQYKKTKKMKFANLFPKFLTYSGLNQGIIYLNVKKLNNLGFFYVRFLRYNFYKKNYFFDAKRLKNII